MLRNLQRTNPRHYAGRRLAKRQREMHISLLEFLKEHNWRDTRSPKPVSADYQHKRYTLLAHMMLVELVEEGYQPTHLKHIKPKHFVALGRRWKAKKLDPQTMQNKLRLLAWVCRTLRKHDCIPDNLAELLPEPELHRARGSVAREEKTFSGHGIDPVPIIVRIAEKDARVALIQLLKAAFGLRNKEAIRLRPHEADHGTYLRVEHGTKGGRVRTVSYFDFEGDFDPEEKEVVLWNLRENRFRVRVIELSKSLVVPDHSMIPLDYSPKRYQRYERYVTARYGGLTKAEVGLTPHAFRHEFLSVRAEGVSGLIRPLRRAIGLDREEAVRDRVGRQVAAIDAGHHDTYTTETYYGPRTEKAPQGVVRGLAKCMKGPIDQPLVCRDVDGNLVGGEGRRIRVLDKPPEPKG